MSDVADAAVHISAVRERSVRVEDVIAAVADPRCGAVCTFVGVVRNHDQARGVTQVDYSAHPSAEQELDRVCRLTAQKFEVHVAAEHRVGELHVGDIAVALAVSAPHRDAAFAACRFLIDTLKSEVPIWKRQIFTDGGEEWVGSDE